MVKPTNVPGNLLTPKHVASENDSYELPDINKINPADLGIGGLDVEVRKIFEAVCNTRLLPKDVIRDAKIKHPKGVILYGPPGTGKTTIVRTLSKVLGAKSCQIVKGPEIFNKYVGESESNVRHLFDLPREDYQRHGEKAGLHLICIDEIDAIAPCRGGRNDSGATDKVINSLLSEMDGLIEFDNFIVFGTTNRLDILDPAIIRPGRFDIKIEIGYPDEKARLSILKIYFNDYIKAKIIDPKIKLDEIAKQTDGYTGADLELIIKQSLIKATNRFILDGRKGKPMITLGDLKSSLADTVSTKSRITQNAGGSNPEMDFINNLSKRFMGSNPSHPPSPKKYSFKSDSSGSKSNSKSNSSVDGINLDEYGLMTDENSIKSNSGPNSLSKID